MSPDTSFSKTARRFRESGFPWHEYLEGGDIEVELSLTPTERTVIQSEWRERVGTVASLHPFFYPRGVAVIGASRNPAGIGYRVLDALVSNDFCGVVYPVNPHATELAGLLCLSGDQRRSRTCGSGGDRRAPRRRSGSHRSMRRKEVRALVVLTAGFAEVGRGGRRSPAIATLEKVRRHGMRMVGPNCFGLLNTDPAVRLNATFSSRVSTIRTRRHVVTKRRTRPGGPERCPSALTRDFHICECRQQSRYFGQRSACSIGKTIREPHVILLYVESFGNPRRFARIARRVSHSKPVVAMKAGRSTAGRRAAASHTAALAASDVGVEALFQQTGVIACRHA